MNISKCSLARLPGISGLAISVMAHASAMAVAGQGWTWGSWGRLRPLESEDLKQQKSPKAHTDLTSCNRLLLLWPFLLILLLSLTHGYQSHKVCEKEEELTDLYPAKI